MGNLIAYTANQPEEGTVTAEQNRLEQVYLNMPEVRFYFSGDREQTEENLKAYIGKEQLEFVSLKRFSEGDGAVYYYVLLDVSASISEGTFSQITAGLAAFGRGLNTQDHLIVITFGEEVKTVLDMTGEELRDGRADSVFSGLVNRDQKTLLFEAVKQTAELAASVPASDSTRRAAFVITDGEDIARGMATKNEALNTLSRTGIPVYGFTAPEAKRDSINALGEFSRTSGGYLTILEAGKASEGFEAVREEIQNTYEAVFTADTNQVSHEMVSAVLEFSQEGEKRQTEAMQDRWIADTEAPALRAASFESSTQVKVIFSEPVSGAEAAENYRLTDGEGTVHTPAYASVGSDGTSAVLTFSGELGGGSYELSCERIADRSMEKNPLEGSISIESEAVRTEETKAVQSQEDAPSKTSLPIYAAAGLAVVLAAAVLVFFMKKGKSGKEMPQKGQSDSNPKAAAGPAPEKEPEYAGAAVLTEQAQTRVRVSVEKPKLAEKKVFFHVKGQREEIPVTIRNSMIVGRSASCELIFDDPAMSRQHFALELAGQSVTIRNLSTSSFTTVNGIRLGASSYSLKPGDEIGAGQLKITIRW